MHFELKIWILWRINPLTRAGLKSDHDHRNQTSEYFFNALTVKILASFYLIPHLLYFGNRVNSYLTSSTVISKMRFFFFKISFVPCFWEFQLYFCVKIILKNQKMGWRTKNIHFTFHIISFVKFYFLPILKRIFHFEFSSIFFENVNFLEKTNDVGFL